MTSQPFSIPPHFIPTTTADPKMLQTNSTWWFVCDGVQLLTRSESLDASPPNDEPSHYLPQAASLKDLGLNPTRTQFLGYLDGQPCIAVDMTSETAEVALCTEKLSAQGLSFQNLRSLYGRLSEDLFAIAARAVQLIEWDRTHQYCGHCATPMTQLPTERAKRCPQCHLRQYPRLSPAVIMLVYQGDKLLLARAPRFRNGMYSVLAGFVEPGESLEETVEREVREEVGIAVKNIRYFGSQPWPFPNSLMIGFTAEYASGTITPDPNEIEAADWFSKTALPPIPEKLSIARQLIDWFSAQ
jgi:NAD+ diphosphatase